MLYRAGSPHSVRHPSVTESVVFPPDRESGITPEYRAYQVGLDGHFIGFEPLVCRDDSEATEKGSAPRQRPRRRALERLSNGGASETRPAIEIDLNYCVRCPHIDGSNDLMTIPSRKEAIERRLEQSRRLSKDANDPTTKERLDKLTGDLEAEQQEQKQDDDR
jgi:hypothetical protein